MAGAPPLVGGVRTEGCGPSAVTTRGRTAAVPGGMCWVGLDVYANGAVGAVFDGATGGWGLAGCAVARTSCWIGWGLRRPLRAVYVGGADGVWAGPAGRAPPPSVV